MKSLALTLSLAAVLMTTEAAAGGLTASEVARRAKSASFELDAKRAELVAAAAEVDRAVASYLPRVALLGRYTRLSDTGSSGAGSIVVAPGAPPGPLAPGAPLASVPLDFPVLKNQYVFQASLTVPVSDYLLRTTPAYEAARESRDATRAELAGTESAVAANAQIAFWSFVRARLSVRVAEQALASSRAHLADVRQALEVGNASQADVLRVESRVSKSELLLETSRNLSVLTEAQLRIALGDPDRTRYAIGEDLGAPLAALPSQGRETLVARALERRPELVALRRAERARRRAATVERAGRYPRLDLFANGYYSNPNQRVFPQEDEFRSSWDAGVQVTWVLSDIPGAGAAAAAADARARSTTAARRAQENQVKLEVTRALGDAREADVAVKTSARGLTAAEESYRVRRLLFQNGKSTSTELLDADADLTRARLDALSARIDARVARVRLSYAIGDEPR